MTKEWKRSLSQSDILSDGQPFDGAKIDQSISSAGASVSDIEAGAEDALEEDIANMSPASNSVAANLDGGVAAVDWSSKTPKVVNVSAQGDNILDISGSGYIIDFLLLDGGKVELSIDGSIVLTGPDFDKIESDTFMTMLARFESSFSVDSVVSTTTDVGVSYVLD